MLQRLIWVPVSFLGPVDGLTKQQRVVSWWGDAIMSRPGVNTTSGEGLLKNGVIIFWGNLYPPPSCWLGVCTLQILVTSLSSFGQEVTLSRVVPHARLKSTREKKVFILPLKSVVQLVECIWWTYYQRAVPVSLCLKKLLILLPLFSGSQWKYSNTHSPSTNL